MDAQVRRAIIPERRHRQDAYIIYATTDSPYGSSNLPRSVLERVAGWTGHHSIVEIDGRWYSFYHDAELSGEAHLRNVEVTELTHNPDGTIETLDPFAT